MNAIDLELAPPIFDLGADLGTAYCHRVARGAVALDHRASMGCKGFGQGHGSIRDLRVGDSGKGLRVRGNACNINMGLGVRGIKRVMGEYRPGEASIHAFLPFNARAI